MRLHPAWREWLLLALAAGLIGLNLTMNAPYLGHFTLLLLAISTLAHLRSSLPLQNILSSAFIITMGSMIAGMLQFGPGFSWTIPLLWMIVLINCRELARFLLLPWRSRPNYGFHLLGLASLLAIQMAWFLPFGTDRALESCALTWSTSLILLLATTPWFIQKHPRERPATWRPLLILPLLHLIRNPI
jgi:hypothetical protein